MGLLTCSGVEMLTCKLSLKFKRDLRFGTFSGRFSSKKREEPQCIYVFYVSTKVIKKIKKFEGCRRTLGPWNQITNKLTLKTVFSQGGRGREVM